MFADFVCRFLVAGVVLAAAREAGGVQAGHLATLGAAAVVALLWTLTGRGRGDSPAPPEPAHKKIARLLVEDPLAWTGFDPGDLSECEEDGKEYLGLRHPSGVELAVCNHYNYGVAAFFSFTPPNPGGDPDVDDDASVNWLRLEMWVAKELYWAVLANVAARLEAHAQLRKDESLPFAQDIPEDKP